MQVRREARAALEVRAVAVVGVGGEDVVEQPGEAGEGARLARLPDRVEPRAPGSHGLTLEFRRTRGRRERHPAPRASSGAGSGAGGPEPRAHRAPERREDLIGAALRGRHGIGGDEQRGGGHDDRFDADSRECALTALVLLALGRVDAASPRRRWRAPVSPATVATSRGDAQRRARRPDAPRAASHGGAGRRRVRRANAPATSATHLQARRWSRPVSRRATGRAAPRDRRAHGSLRQGRVVGEPQVAAQPDDAASQVSAQRLSFRVVTVETHASHGVAAVRESRLVALRSDRERPGLRRRARAGPSRARAGGRSAGVIPSRMSRRGR